MHYWLDLAHKYPENQNPMYRNQERSSSFGPQRKNAKTLRREISMLKGIYISTIWPQVLIFSEIYLPPMRMGNWRISMIRLSSITKANIPREIHLKPFRSVGKHFYNLIWQRREEDILLWPTYRRMNAGLLSGCGLTGYARRSLIWGLIIIFWRQPCALLHILLEKRRALFLRSMNTSLLLRHEISDQHGVGLSFFLDAGMNFMPGLIWDMSCSTTMSSYSGANYPSISNWTFFIIIRMMSRRHSANFEWLSIRVKLSLPRKHSN